MRHLKKIIPVGLLALLLVIGVTALSPKVQAATSGTCGDNLTWTLDDAGTLTISGTGPMENYNWNCSPWYNNSAIAAIVIEPGVTTIGEYAFCGCSSLQSVTIPDSVTSVGYQAFYGCSSLTSVTIPDSVTSIGDFAFADCSSLTSVHITDLAAWCNIDFENLDSNPLYYADKLYLNGKLVTDLVIPDSVTTIGDYAFCSCDSLTSVTIGDSVTTIGESAFWVCDSLTSVTIGDSVTSISSYAFLNCHNLTSITIPDSVTSIGDYAFLSSWPQNVYYAGSQNQWNSISIGSSNKGLTDATIHYNHLHNYALFPTVTVDATCTASGYIEYTCIYGDTYRNTIPALGHDYSGPVKTVKTTCTEDGYSGVSCTRCDSVRQDQVFTALGHNAVVIALRDPTCTEQGITTVGTMCDRCKSVFVQPTYSPALGHDYVDGTCSRCQAVDPDYNANPGDLTGDNQTNNEDVVLLLWHTLFPLDYPLEVSGDLTGDGRTDNEDVVLLLWHTLFPEDYPL